MLGDQAPGFNQPTQAEIEQQDKEKERAGKKALSEEVDQFFLTAEHLYKNVGLKEIMAEQLGPNSKWLNPTEAKEVAAEVHRLTQEMHKMAEKLSILLH